MIAEGADWTGVYRDAVRTATGDLRIRDPTARH